MHSEGGITAERGGMVICRTSELHNQGLSGAFGACKSFAPEGAISIGKGLPPPRPPWIRPWNLQKKTFLGNCTLLLKFFQFQLQNVNRSDFYN